MSSSGTQEESGSFQQEQEVPQRASVSASALPHTLIVASSPDERTPPRLQRVGGGEFV